ncbi:MAG TPA: hypothetical protein PKD79_00230 [Candidatus Doudnabacteria bacterium]|nr:hypothetical protein [Candidatus Doudnabacteria bacterium]
MSKQALYSIIALIVLLIVGGIIFAQSNRDSEQADNDSLNRQDQELETSNGTELLPIDSEPGALPPDNGSSGRFSGEDDIMAPDVAVHEISFSGTAFSPANITIKNGDIVVFKNNSNKNF